MGLLLWGLCQEGDTTPGMKVFEEALIEVGDQNSGGQ